MTDTETVKRKKIIFMTLFYVVMAVTLILFIGLWNHVSDFKTAYLQALIFLQVMNWYDGIVIDKVWVGYSKFLSLIWFVGAAVVAGIFILIF